MKQKLYRKLFLVLFFLVLRVLYAEEFHVNLGISRSIIKTGETFNVFIDYKDFPDSLKFNFSLLFPSETKEFERLELPENNREKKIVKAKYTSFSEPGKYFFGPLQVSYDKNIYVTDSLEIMVESFIQGQKVTVTDSAGTKKELPLDSLNTVLPIKELKEYTLTDSEKRIIYYSIAGFIVFVLLLVYLIRKSKNRNKDPKEIRVVKEPTKPAHEIALAKLNDLLEKKYLSKGLFKDYAVELSYIFREYLENRFKFEAKELPTSEIKLKINDFKLEAKQLERLESVLDVTDLIKYAKFMPLEMELKNRFEEVESFVNDSILQSENNIKK